MNGKTLALAGGAVGLALVVVGGFALLHDEPDKAHNVRPPGGGPAPPSPPQVPPLTPGSPAPPPSGTPATPNKGWGSPPPPPSTANGNPRPHVNAPPAPPAPSAKEPPRPGKGGGPVVVVHSPDNHPVFGAVVEARTAKGTLPARPTNKDGEAALDFVAASDGRISGTVRHPRFEKAATFSCDPGTARVEVRFADSAVGVLVGVIRDARGHAPGEAELTVLDPNGQETVLSTASFVSYDAGNGHFKVELAPGSYSVKAAAEGYVPSDFSYPDVVAGKETICMDLVLEQACSILGHVALPPDLQAQRDPVVLQFDLECVRGTIENPNTTPIHLSAQVDRDGGFMIQRLQPGMYRIRASDGQHMGAWAAAKLDEGAQIGVNLSLNGGGEVSRIRGFVQDSRGGIIAGATVRTKFGTLTTDQGGAFELRGLDPGRQDIVIEKQGFVRLSAQVNVPMPGDPPVADQVFVLSVRGSAAGKVTRKGAPAAGVSVLVVQKTDVGGVKTYGPVTTDASGSWQLGDLDAGDYYLKVGAKADPFDPTGAPTFRVSPGEQAQVGSVEAPD